MTAHSDIQITELQRIERALDELLRTAINRPPWRPRIDGPVSIGAILDDFLNQTPAQRAADDLLDNPVGEAVRRAVTVLGERLYEIGGLNLMQNVLDRVAERDASHQNWRVDIMDKRWDGIGRTATNAGWAC